MNVVLDENGQCLPDAGVEDFVRRSLSDKCDLHIAQALVIDVIRSQLINLPKNERPEIRWFFYGREVYFDKDFRSYDAWHDPRMNVSDRALSTIIGWSNNET